MPCKLEWRGDCGVFIWSSRGWFPVWSQESHSCHSYISCDRFAYFCIFGPIMALCPITERDTSSCRQMCRTGKGTDSYSNAPIVVLINYIMSLWSTRTTFTAFNEAQKLVRRFILQNNNHVSFVFSVQFIYMVPFYNKCHFKTLDKISNFWSVIFTFQMINKQTHFGVKESRVWTTAYILN